MPRDGSGNYNLPTGQPVVTGTTISATVFNTFTADLQAAITASLARNGETTPTANLPMGGFRHTGVADGTARNNYATVGQLQDDQQSVISSVAGTNAITGSMTPSISSYPLGMTVTLVPTGANTTAVTIALNGLSAKNIVKFNSLPLVANDLLNGVPAYLIYNGTSFFLLNPQTLPVAQIAGLGTLATQSGTFSGTSSGTNTGDQTNITGNSATVAGFSPSASGTGNTLALRNGSGYLFAGYFNSSSPVEGGTITNMWFETGGDGYLRKMSFANVMTQINAVVAIAETQIADGSLLARVGSNETISGGWTYSIRPKSSSAGGFLSHANSANAQGSIIVTGTVPTDTTGMSAGDIKLVF